MFIVVLILLGLCAGSFVSALTWRIKVGKDWVRGRSQCPECGHKLAAKDLVPVASWLILRGRCRYCGKKISIEYPVVEVISALVFVSLYVFWPTDLALSGQKLLLGGWLLVSVGLLALALYDWRWKLLPNLVLLPTAIVAIFVRLLYIVHYSSQPGRMFWHWLLAVLVASGIFLSIYLMSNGKWIGSGDISLGVITGSVLGEPNLAMLMIFFASLAGTMVALPGLLAKKAELKTQIPYGPYLITASLVSLLFGNSILSWYEHLFR